MEKKFRYFFRFFAILWFLMSFKYLKLFSILIYLFPEILELFNKRIKIKDLENELGEIIKLKSCIKHDSIINCLLNAENKKLKNIIKNFEITNNFNILKKNLKENKFKNIGEIFEEIYYFGNYEIIDEKIEEIKNEIINKEKLNLRISQLLSIIIISIGIAYPLTIPNYNNNFIVFLLGGVILWKILY